MKGSFDPAGARISNRKSSMTFVALLAGQLATWLLMLSVIIKETMNPKWTPGSILLFLIGVTAFLMLLHATTLFTLSRYYPKAPHMEAKR